MSYQFLEIPIKKISPYKTYMKTEIVEHFIQTEYMLAAPAKHLSTQAVYALLELHPVQVVHSKHDEYLCVGGIRSFSIARNCLSLSDTIPVILISKMKEDATANRCLTDIFITTACLSIKSSESMFRYFQIIPEYIKNEMFKQPHGPSQLARMLNVTRETVRKWKNKNKTPS